MKSLLGRVVRSVLGAADGILCHADELLGLAFRLYVSVSLVTLPTRSLAEFFTCFAAPATRFLSIIALLRPQRALWTAEQAARKLAVRANGSSITFRASFPGHNEHVLAQRFSPAAPYGRRR